MVCYHSLRPASSSFDILKAGVPVGVLGPGVYIAAELSAVGLAGSAPSRFGCTINSPSLSYFHSSTVLLRLPVKAAGRQPDTYTVMNTGLSPTPRRSPQPASQSPRPTMLSLHPRMHQW